MDHISTTENRRRFFRIDDKVNLQYKIVDEQAALNTNKVNNELLNSSSIVTALDELNQEAKLVMLRVKKIQPEVAEYLKILDSKIDLVAQETIRQSNNLLEKNIRNANISATGLAFENSEEIKEGELLKIKLLLTSCSAVIIIYGQVIYCRNADTKDDSMPYLIGLDYVNINEQDREILIKHVVKRQMQQIRDMKAE
jgi:c-di-GMP-binding flagellar brake protein YcgR